MQEAGAVVAEIKRENKSISIDITLKYTNDKPRSNVTFEQQLGVALMKILDKEAKRKCKELTNSGKTYSIKYKGIAVLIIENYLIAKNINVLIREIDMKI